MVRSIQTLSFNRIFLVLSLVSGICVGYLTAFTVYQPRFNSYSLRIDVLDSEVSRLNAVVSELEEEIGRVRQHIDVFYGDITVEQTKRLIDKIESLLIIDVRSPSEFDGVRIEGAKNIPLDRLDDRLWELETEDEILVYCGSGVRSSLAMDILSENGFSMVYNLLGGIEAWSKAGYPLGLGEGCPCETP